jgi:basic membrane protein A
VFHVGLFFVRPSGAAAARIHSDENVGIVFDVGGRGDKSFNDGGDVGGTRAERELGAHERFIEPGDGSDRESGLRQLAAEGMDLVIGVGVIFTDDISQLA